MRVLYCYGAFGFGHRATALAVDAALNAVCGNDFDSFALDPFSGRCGFLRAIPRLYDSMTRQHEPVYNRIFRATDSMSNRGYTGVLPRALMVQKIRRAISAVMPDVVIVCNPFHAAEHVALAREESGLSFPIVTIVTDPVNPHMSWISPRADMNFVVVGGGYQKVVRRGAAESRLREIGYPLHPNFTSTQLSRGQARSRLALRTDIPVILVSGGGVGSGPIIDWLHRLAELAARDECQVIVATGTNRHLRQALMERRTPNMTALRTDLKSLHVPMLASAAVISKAGPATIFEAAAVGVPLLLTAEVGEQERGNIALAEYMKVAVDARREAVDVLRLAKTWSTPDMPLDLFGGASDVANWIQQEINVLRPGMRLATKRRRCAGTPL